MPDEGFSYGIGIEDQLSGPARAEVSALKALQGQIDMTEKSLRALRREQLLNKELGIKDKGAGIRAQRLGLDLGEMKAELRTLKPPPELERTPGLLSQVGEHLGKGLVPALLLASAIEEVGKMAVEAAIKVGEIGIEATKFAIEAAEFRHNTEIAYTAVKGTAAEGEETFRQIDAMAKAVHMPTEKAHELARDLMLQGLEGTKEVGAVIAADSALMRTGQLEGAAKLKTIIERSLASGHFDIGRGMGGAKGAMSGRALAGLGIHLPELIADIGKRTGKSTGEVKLALQQGTIDTKIGIQALTDAIDKSPIGKAAKEKFDFEDVVTEIKNTWRGLVQDIDLKPLEQGFTDFTTALHELEGPGVKSFFQTIVDGVGHAITDVTILALTWENEFLQIELAIKPVTDEIDKLSASVENLTGHGIASNIITGLVPELSPIFDANAQVAPAHASGGRVMEPAPGEMFASVAPGEFIVPAGGGGPGNDNAGGSPIHVDVGGLHFHGPVDQHNVIPLLESQMADVFERVALERGR